MSLTKVSYSMINGAPVNIVDYGADATGVADSASAIQAAIDTGRPVYVPNGTFKVNSALTTSAATFAMFGDNRNAVLDFSGGGSLSVSSTLTQISDLSAAITGGGNTATFTSAHGLALDDVFLVYNPTDFSFGLARDYYRNGSMFRVADVASATEVKMFGTAQRGFAAASVDVYKMNGGAVYLKDFRIIPSSGLITVNIVCHQYVRIDGVEVDEGTGDTAIQCQTCFDINITNVKSESLNGDSYPIALSNSQKAVITQCSLYSYRHCITLGGADVVGGVPTRDVLVSNCILMNNPLSNVGAADAHGNCENITYQGCTINAFVNLGGENCNVIGCTVYGRSPDSPDIDGGCIWANEVVGGTYTFKDNRFVSYGNWTLRGCIYFVADETLASLNIVCTNNSFENKSATPTDTRLVHVFAGNTGDTPVGDLAVVIDGLVNKQSVAGNAVLWIQGSLDRSNTAEYIVDNITAPSGTRLMIHNGGSNNELAKMRLQRQAYTVDVNTPSGSAQTNATTWTYRYPYPRRPVVSCSTGPNSSTGSASAVKGGKIVIPFVQACSSTITNLGIASGDGTNFTSTEALSVFGTAEITEI
jgi:hypothetical protein